MRAGIIFPGSTFYTFAHCRMDTEHCDLFWVLFRPWKMVMAQLAVQGSDGVIGLTILQ